MIRVSLQGHGRSLLHFGAKLPAVVAPVGNRLGALRSLLVLALALPTSLAGQERTLGRAEPGRIVGTVIDAEHAPIRGATVILVDQGRSATATDGEGRFAIVGVSPGTHRLLVSALGFAPARLSASVSATGDESLTVTMQRTALELAGVTVSATTSERDPLSVAQPVSTLGPRDLERSLGATLARTLSWTSGVTERSQGPAASMPVIRGLTGERIVVLQDGQRAGDLAGSASDHGVTIDPLAAHRVEIVRGPAALMHGSTALGGVVNVISDDIARVVPSQRLASITVNAQSASEGGGALVDVTQPLEGGWVLRMKGGARSHRDQRTGGGAGSPPLDNTSLRNQQGVLALARVGENSSGGIALRRYDFEYGLPWRDAPADGVRLRGARNEVTARAEREAHGPFTRVRFDGTAQWYAHDEVLTDGQVATALALRTQQGQLLARTRTMGALRDGAVGLSVLTRQNAVRGEQALTPPNDNATLAAFAFQELAPWGRDGDDGHRTVRLPIALRIDHVRTRSETSERFGPAIVRRFTNLSASAGVTIPLWRNASVALNAARAARVPSPEELFSRAGHAGTGAFEIGNPQLASEITRGIDAVLRVERSALRAQVALFHSSVAGWVGLYPAGRDTTVRVTGLPDKTLPLFAVAQRDARISGAEASVEASVRPRLIVSANADVLRARDDEGSALPFMPPARVGGGMRWDDGRWQLGGAARRVFAQRRVYADEFPTDAYTVLEAHVGVRLILGARVHTLMLRGENLGDRLFREATSRIKDFAPAAGRNTSLLYRITF